MTSSNSYRAEHEDAIQSILTCVHYDMRKAVEADLRRLLNDVLSSGPKDSSLFRDRTPEAAAWQCAMMFAQATEWLLEIHSDAWKHLPLYIKNPLRAHVASLVYHARDLNVRPVGLGGKALPKLKYGLDTPGFYGEVEVVRLDPSHATGNSTCKGDES